DGGNAGDEEDRSRGARARPRGRTHCHVAETDAACDEAGGYNRSFVARGHNSPGPRASLNAERYRSGRNGGASKASCRVSGTWVRIPPSPPFSCFVPANE